MATVTHYIYSNYDSEDRERLEAETGQLDADVDVADPWLTGKSFAISKRIANAPRFVAATIAYDDWASAGTSANFGNRVIETGEEENVSEWYRTLSRKASGGSSRVSTPPSPRRNSASSKKSPPRGIDKSWFLSRALEASRSLENEGSSSEHLRGSKTPQTQTLADILARDPPPLPSEAPYTPPVWLSIGPGNKGFDMLQKSGWEEGEALGRASRSRGGLGYAGKGNGKNGKSMQDEEVMLLDEIKKEVIDLSMLDGNIIDLTEMDDEAEEDQGGGFAAPENANCPTLPVLSDHLENTLSDLDHSPRALLTPLPTILKADKLGIGLKAKTVGSGLYREPVKRVTHSQAAVSAHVRASEALRRTKKLVGKGSRGFARLKKKEEEGRRNMLAYLNAD
ncbi:hypothetical protein EW145_g3849 [Phellinidium pouzarii]|uniref:G-patch domain-containing protein n=1 Tax=Phellinidium pouzarii TaxID=167371 RepID=A0A4S4L5L5_9AGAM|nr:hypothetical protein EW145_g3849 [Phellinidium pouzarii]